MPKTIQTGTIQSEIMKLNAMLMNKGGWYNLQSLFQRHVYGGVILNNTQTEKSAVRRIHAFGKFQLEMVENVL